MKKVCLALTALWAMAPAAWASETTVETTTLETTETTPELQERTRPAVELGLGPGLFSATARSASPFWSGAHHVSGQAYAAVEATDWLDVRLHGSLVQDGDHRLRGVVGASMEMATVGAGVGFSLPLAGGPWVQLRGMASVDLEAVHGWLQLAGQAAAYTAWAFGAVPQAGLELRFRLASNANAPHLVARLSAGFAFRTTLDLQAPSTSTADLGAFNPSGVVGGFTLGTRF